MFLHLSVILSTGRCLPLVREVSATHPPVETSQAPPWEVEGQIPVGRHPPRRCMLGHGQQAGGTHPTGMHSCFKKLFVTVKFLCFINIIHMYKNWRLFVQLKSNLFKADFHNLNQIIDYIFHIELPFFKK